MTEHWLIFGATSAIGRGVQARLDARRDDCTCVTRGAKPVGSRARWIVGALPEIRIDVGCDFVASLGPLDAFVRWLEHASLAGVRRVVALSSTSIHVKRGSSDLAERALAETLAASEAALVERCSRAGVAWTVLRPTLIYGAGGALAEIAVLARRFRFALVPRGANGKRMPVHVGDVAAAVVAATAAEAAADRAYDLPGGEAIAYRAMVARVLAALPSRPRLVVAPDVMARPLLALAARLRGGSPALVARMCDDLVFDAAPAGRDFGYAPRAFDLDATMLEGDADSRSVRAVS